MFKSPDHLSGRQFNEKNRTMTVSSRQQPAIGREGESLPSKRLEWEACPDVMKRLRGGWIP
jgi:hypothetical protein